jgi:hypothetical protein
MFAGSVEHGSLAAWLSSQRSNNWGGELTAELEKMSLHLLQLYSFPSPPLPTLSSTILTLSLKIQASEREDKFFGCMPGTREF